MNLGAFLRMKTRIFIVRHTETVGNIEKRYSCIKKPPKIRTNTQYKLYCFLLYTKMLDECNSETKIMHFGIKLALLSYFNKHYDMLE